MSKSLHFIIILFIKATSLHFYTFPHTYSQCSSIKCSSQFKYFITTRHFMWTEQKITIQLNFTFFTFIKSNANQSCLFWNIHVAPKTMFKGNNSCILLYKIQKCWYLIFFRISLIIFPLPWNHLWQNQITADWLLYWWKMRHISFQEMCDNTIWFMNANRFLVEVKLSTPDICVTMKACFI